MPPPVDVTGDGHIDLLLPGPEDYGVFEGGPDEQFNLKHRFSTVNADLAPSELPNSGGRFSTQVQFNRQDGLVVRINARPNTAFENFLDAASNDDSRVLLDRSVWQPPAVFSAITGPDSNDILTLALANMDPPAIARQQNVNEQTIYRELSKLVVSGKLSLEQALGLSHVEIGIIQDALLSQANLAEDTFSYRQIKEQLADDWPTGVLHCVRQAILAQC